MDAQNAAQSDQTRPAGDSPQRPDSKPDTSKSTPPPAAGYRPELEKSSSSIHARGDPVKKKRISSAHIEREKLSRGKDAAASSGLSSAPASPPHHRQQQRRRFADDTHSSSDSEHSHPRPAKSIREKLKSGENTASHKRKSLKVESDDEGESRKVRRQRTTSASIDSGRPQKEHKPLSAKSHHDSQNRSISPQARSHRRSASSQLPAYSSNGLGHKKRRLPPPLHATDYHSDDSSASGSHPRSSKLRNLATPAADTNASPARMAPHKKHLDAHGQTLLARACARGEYEGAKTRLTERPEDLNVADYAGNTPLQIAAINGCEDIVKLLIDAGCNLDCVNYDKDTPLLDAVDNGHLGVVKLLLDAGVNPRKANVNGEEPIDRVSDETDNAEEIRAALMAARKRAGDRRRTSEEHHSHQDQDTRDSHAPDSPRHSPATNSGTSRRTGTVRATKTRNDLLYMPLDDKTLRQAAGRGDEETVARILQVKEGYNDPAAMVAAARGGHDLVIQLLLGLGGANPDPRPIFNAQPEFATPILAAIGQENIKVIELLLEQAGFDPTRRYRGETYYEIARHRAGPNWKDEEHMLKNAYDEFKRSGKKTNSRQEQQDEALRARRAKEEARQHKRSLSSPEPKKKSTTSKLTSPKEKRRSNSITNQGDEGSKRGPGRPRKDDPVPSINISDREQSPTISQKQLKAKHADSDAAGVSSEGETHKPRRKLVSKGELRGERERQRRASMASNASSFKDHPSSPHESKHEESGDKHDKHEKNRVEKLSEKYHDRTKALKRDESRDRLSVSGDGSTKRHRASITPDRPSNGEKDDSEVPPKRRRLDSETKEKRPKQVVSSDERPRKSSNLQDSSKSSSKPSHKKHDEEKRDRRADSHRADTDRASSVEKQIHVKSEETDVEMKDADSIKAVSESELQAARAKEAEQEKQKQTDEETKKKDELRKKHEARKKEEEPEEARRQHEEEERKERERRERAHREDMERKRAAREAEQRRFREEQERIRLDKLPPLLRWLDTCPNPKLPVLAEKFKRIQGCRYDTIRREANGTAEGREQWVLNTHAALLLGEKDLDLSRYTAWERAPVTDLAKLSLWRVEWRLYSLLDDKLWDLGRQLPEYYGDEDPSELGFETKQRLKAEAWEKFFNMDMFFVKVSDLMYTVPNIPHLRHIRLEVEYRELLETEAQSRGWGTCQKWKQDPDSARYNRLAPRCKYYHNGAFVGEDKPQLAQTSSTPFLDKKVPRRGLVQVFPDDPDYTRICLEQGLEHLINGHLSPPLVNGIHSSPMSQKSMASGGPPMNGMVKALTPGSTSESLTISNAGHETLVNGINGNTNGNPAH
ncbi:hypothetical protein AU210_006632 [Fusarium oxysporum f. sp. radicis-cucumerinum]|uniref:Uncharacterized protein n=1 Tax=Fusarium oxysporum f. sp. radicis-cucumerinum TaxID=327505 RepID=A0A2H3HLU4_FUSOX|nr:hypothetical protein AU210_006632 [Fusarium oxysporum f. sp. radicis-cucumerinum]